MKQRLYPSTDESAVMLRHCGDARFVFNIGLEQRSLWTEGRRHYTQKVTTASQMRELAELRGELDWLRAGSSVVQQGALRDLDRAFTNFFAGRAGYPKFKKRDDSRGAFVVRDLTVRRLSRKWGEVTVPKVGPVRFRLSRNWSDIAVATSARVTLQHGRWHVSFTTPPKEKVPAGTGALVGIDRGVANTLATSDGDLLHAPSLTVGEQTRFIALQRRLARQGKGPKRRARSKAALGRLRMRLNDRRTDWVEQTTTTLARTYDFAAIENLNTRGMTRKATPRPDPENPGTYLPNGAAAKSGLNRAILASCWGKVETRLGHKMNVIPVPAPNTSRQCNDCGHISAGNRKSQAVFECETCGHEAHADINAACNIADRALRTINPRASGDRTHQSRKSRVNHLAA